MDNKGIAWIFQLKHAGVRIASQLAVIDAMPSKQEKALLLGLWLVREARLDQRHLEERLRLFSYHQDWLSHG